MKLTLFTKVEYSLLSVATIIAIAADHNFQKLFELRDAMITNFLNDAIFKLCSLIGITAIIALLIVTADYSNVMLLRPTEIDE